MPEIEHDIRSYTQMQVMFEEFVPRLRNPQFSEPAAFVRDYFVNGIKSMPIVFDVEQRAV